MTERDRVTKYLHERVQNAFNADQMEHAHHLNGLLSTVENMTDDEFETGMATDAVAA